jgi:hypothetical protein
MAVATAIRGGRFVLFALRGEDRRRKGDQFRQLSEVLGGGGQQELVFGAARPAQAQSVEPEDALEMRKDRWLRGLTLRTNAEAVADDEHPDHQLWVNRGPPNLTVKRASRAG